MKGHFLIKLIRHNKTIETVTVESSWVDANFKPEVIGQVHWVAYETKEILEFATPDVPTLAKHGYISVKKRELPVQHLTKG